MRSPSHRQLSLIDNTPPWDLGGSADLQGEPGSSWVGRNRTARGTYYHFYWQSSEGDRRITRNRYIRGSAVGTELGESRRQLVESLIASGQSPAQICRVLESLPRSARRRRWPDWSSAG